MGARSAIWMNDAHLIKNLQEIRLYRCLNWEILPPFGLLPFLKILFVRKMPKVKRLENKFHGNDMCSVFPSLETLHLECMKELVDWFDANVVDRLFPCLTHLRLFDCPNLQDLPYLPPKLKSLQISNIWWKTLNCCSISKSIPLKKLDVYDCPYITSISLAGDIVKLKSVTIRRCPCLISLGEEHQQVNNATENCHFILDELTISDPSLLQMEPLRSCASIKNLKISEL